MPANPGLGKENRTSILDLDGYRGDRDRDRRKDEADDREEYVGASLEALEDRLPCNLESLLEEPDRVDPVERDLPPVDLVEYLQRVGWRPVKVELNQVERDRGWQLLAGFLHHDGLHGELRLGDLIEHCLKGAETGSGVGMHEAVPCSHPLALGAECVEIG